MAIDLREGTVDACNAIDRDVRDAAMTWAQRELGACLAPQPWKERGFWLGSSFVRFDWRVPVIAEADFVVTVEFTRDRRLLLGATRSCRRRFLLPTLKEALRDACREGGSDV